MKKRLFIMFLIIFVGISFIYAEENQFNENYTVYWDNVVNTGKDNGYLNEDVIKNGDPHYGWKLGKFALSGFSSKRLDEEGNYILFWNKTLMH